MILISLTAALALMGCGEGESPSADVVATTAIAADIVQEVAGPDASVEQLVPEGASPHGYSASAKERAELEDADLVVAWGAGLEEGLPLDGLEVFKLADGQTDPHVWMDPSQIARRLPKLADALAERDPGNAGGYRERARSYAERLLELDAEIAELLLAVPPGNRKLVTSHDALAHFAHRYSFDVVGSPFGLVPESEASAERVSELIDAVKLQRVPAVFAEESDDPELMRQIAREAGVQVVDDLLIEGFGGDADSYAEMLRQDAELIASALGG